MTLLLPLSLYAEIEPVDVNKNFHKTYFTGNFGYASLDLPVGSYSDPGLSLGLGYFFYRKVAFDAHYFLTPSATGASNLNGFGVRAKYYFLNSETTSFIKIGKSKVTIFDKYFAYASLGFVDREVRTSSLSVSYSGFAPSAGWGYKFNDKSALGVDVQYSKLENPSGSAIKDGATLIYVSAFYTYFL